MSERIVTLKCKGPNNNLSPVDISLSKFWVGGRVCVGCPHVMEKRFGLTRFLPFLSKNFAICVSNKDDIQKGTIYLDEVNQLEGVIEGKCIHSR